MVLACASVMTLDGRPAVGSLKSLIPVCRVQRNARSAEALLELPSSSPESLTSRDHLELAPARLTTGTLFTVINTASNEAGFRIERSRNGSTSC